MKSVLLENEKDEKKIVRLKMSVQQVEEDCVEGTHKAVRKWDADRFVSSTPQTMQLFFQYREVLV